MKMESLEYCYPANYFDPFANEPTHGECEGCGKVFDYGDMTRVGPKWDAVYFCDNCFEKIEPEEN